MKIITIAGHVGKDATLQYTADGGLAIMKVSVAVREYGSDEPTWFTVTMFGKRAEGLAKHITKGMYVVAVGELKVKDREGGGSWLDVEATEIEMRGGERKQDSTPEDREDIPF